MNRRDDPRQSDSARRIEQMLPGAAQKTAPARGDTNRLRFHLGLVAEALAAAPADLRSPALLFKAGNGAVKALDLSKEFTFGRAENCSVSCPGYLEISRVHFTIRPVPGAHLLTDTSSNGTFIQGKRVRRSELRSGDVISAGPFLFIFI
jgi:hypothetical protein